jgi:hypothetical protein
VTQSTLTDSPHLITTTVPPDAGQVIAVAPVAAAQTTRRRTRAMRRVLRTGKPRLSVLDCVVWDATPR